MRFAHTKYASDWKSLWFLPVFFLHQRKKIYHPNLFHPKIKSNSDSMRKSQPNDIDACEYRTNEIRIFIFEANKIAFCLFIHLFCARRFFRKYFFCLFCDFFSQNHSTTARLLIIAEIPAWFRTEVLFAIIQFWPWSRQKPTKVSPKCANVEVWTRMKISRRGVAFLLSNIKAEFTHQSQNKDGK